MNLSLLQSMALLSLTMVIPGCVNSADVCANEGHHVITSEFANGTTQTATIDVQCSGSLPEDGALVKFTFELNDTSHTPFGSFVVETDSKYTPKTVENFLAYVDSGYFVNLTVHRVAPGFVIQAGGYEQDYTTRHTALPPIPLEAHEDKPNKQWTLSMARTNAPDSATSEFFVNLKNNTNLDSTGPNTGYAVFGHVVSGFETIEAMTEVEPGKTFSAGGFFPKTAIVITSAQRVN